ncbi:hypothetical protein AB0M72_07170 [Nocardiopsis dassonvillei]
MRQVGLASYRERVSCAAGTLISNQGFDGGWGLTLTSVSSIVNTSEVLAVLRSAQVAGEPVRRALFFLAAAIKEHCRPRRQGGRGENTRFVCFGLMGLTTYPEFFHHPGLVESASWCVNWLERHRVEHGWPEIAGIDDTSIHQTALAVVALSRLRDLLQTLAPEPHLTAGDSRSPLVDRIALLVQHGLSGLLYHRRRGGSWGWRTYVSTESSPSKTSLCLIAVDAATSSVPGVQRHLIRRDDPRDVGGVNEETQRRTSSEVIAEAGAWLLANYRQWESFIEDDKDVQGTAWQHMAYALSTRAVLVAGASPYDPRLAGAWKLMDSLWDSESGMWGEPGGSGQLATIRATYYTVGAFEAARERVNESGMSEQPLDAGDLSVNGNSTAVLSFVLDRTHSRIDLTTLTGAVSVQLPERLFELACVLQAAGPGGCAVTDIASSLGVAESSVAKYVQRFNRTVAARGEDAPTRTVLACRIDRASGYRFGLDSDAQQPEVKPDAP